MSTLQLINLNTGGIVRQVAADVADSIKLTKGQALLDPETQSYDPRRKIIRARMIPRPLTSSEREIVKLTDRVEALEESNRNYRLALIEVTKKLGLAPPP